MARSALMVCLANSYRPGGHCIAGKLLGPEGFTTWLRPVSLRPTAELLACECHYPTRETPRPRDLVHLHLERAAPQGHQTENILIDPTYTWRKLGTIDHQAISTLCDKPKTLWTLLDQTVAGRYNCVAQADAANVKASLFLIEVHDLTLRVVDSGRDWTRAHYGVFIYGGEQYILRTTDPQAFAAMMAQPAGDYPIGHAFLCISLSRLYDKDMRCHKLIAGIITSPEL